MQRKRCLYTLALAILMSQPVWGQEVTPTAEKHEPANTTPGPDEASSAPEAEEQNLAQAASSPDASSSVSTTAEQPQATANPGDSFTTSKPVTKLEEFTVTSRRPTSSASSDTMRARDFELRPHTTTQQLLNNLPGLLVGQHQGGGQAGTTPLARSTGGELGVRTNLWEQLDLAAALWILDLNSEIVFVGDEGTTEASGPTRRWGIDFETRYPLLDWLYADFDLSYADPRFRVTGQAIPLAITLLMNGGLTARFSDGLSGALRFRYIDDRPLNENRTLTARCYYLVDLIFQYRWRNIEVSLQLLNLTNNDWRETQFDTNSCVRSEVGVDPRCPATGSGEGIEDNNFTPGSPINVQGGVTLFF